MLATRIKQLGGKPISRPEDWYKMTNCGYAAPDDPFIEKLLIQNIEGEQCAIDVYKKMLDITKDDDPITYNLSLQLLEDEVEHEDDLQSLLEDFKLIFKR